MSPSEGAPQAHDRHATVRIADKPLTGAVAEYGNIGATIAVVVRGNRDVAEGGRTPRDCGQRPVDELRMNHVPVLLR